MNKHKTTKLNMKRTLLSSAILFELTLGSAVAATINVENDCTLIDAIQSANTDTSVGTCTAGNGADIIQLTERNALLNLSEAFGPSAIFPQSIALGLPAIRSHITIEGNGLTIDADTSVNKFRILEVLGDLNTNDVSLTLKDTVVKGGDPAINGNEIAGGLFALRAPVHLENTQFIENRQGAVLLGASFGSSIKDSVFRDNSVFNPRSGIALELSNSEVTIERSSFVNNRFDLPTFYDLYRQQSVSRGINPSRGGAVAIYASDVSISNTTISGNTGFESGGLSNSFGFSTRGLAQTSVETTIRGYREPQTVSITNSTITDNTSRIAPGIFNRFTEDADIFRISGSIVSGNNATISQTGREIFSSESPAGLDGTFYLDNFNIIGEKGDPGLRDLTLGPNDILLQNATSELLYPLTESNQQFLHPLKARSVAIDAIPVSCFDLVLDQEGNSRAMDGNSDGNALCDIGASEKSAEIFVDETTCSLQDAIVAANTDSNVGGCTAGLGADVIQLPSGSEQALTSVVADFDGNSFGLPLITSAIAIEGNESDILRASGAPEFGIAAVVEGGDLLLHQTSLSQGSGTFAGIFSDHGNLSVQRTVISNMTGIAFSIRNAAKVLIENSTIKDNTIPTDTPGLGIGNGAIQTDTVKVQGSLFTGNTGNVGAALNLRDNGNNSIKNTTISGNNSSDLSALVIQGAAQIDGITVTNNTAETGAGGAFFSTEPVDFVTPQAIEIRNSIFSGNIINDSPNRGVSESAAEIFHLSQDGVGVVSFNNIFGQNGDAGVFDVEIDAESIVPAVATSAVIGPLQNNGGFNLSHEPIANGLAIDAGEVNCRLTEDQLNHIRPLDGDGDDNNRCDIGAVELDSFNPDDLIFLDGFEDTTQ